LAKQQQVNKKLDVRINDEKLMLTELRDKIRECKAKMTKTLKEHESRAKDGMKKEKLKSPLGDVCSSGIVESDELKLKEKPKSSFGDVCTPVILESEDTTHLKTSQYLKISGASSKRSV